MDYLRKTFPNATNPMKIIPSPSLPNLKVQRLNVLNKLSTMKGSCIAINSNDGTEQSAAAASEASSSEQLERRTIDSKHISMVATKSEDDICKSSKAKESQRNNFGLYALKFHRNLSTHANSMIQSFKKDIGKRSKSSSKTVVETNVSESPEFTASARANRSKHEHFEPCHQQIHYRRNSEHHYDDDDDDSEFGDTNSGDVWNNSNRFQRNRLKSDEDTDAMDGPDARAPVRPRRLKPVAPKANLRTGQNVNARQNTFQTRNQQYLPYDGSAHNMDNFGSDDQNVMNI